MTAMFTIETLSTAPRLHVVDDFVTDGEIEHVLRLAEHPEQLAPGLVPDRSVAGLSFEMPVGRDEVLNGIRARIAEVLGFGNDLGETFRFRRYVPGEGHPPHTDAYASNGSELIVTALICLVPPSRGGETTFPLAADGPLAVSHRRGRLVLWFNHTPDGQVDTLSTHEGALVEAGEKTTLTAFVYKPTYYAASPFPAEHRSAPERRVVCLHGGANPHVTKAWANAAAWMGGAVTVCDARGTDAVPEADVYLPADLSPAVRRVLTSRYRAGWRSVFTDAPRRCEDVLLFLAREGFPVRPRVPLLGTDADLLDAAVQQVGGFPVEACIGPWIGVHDPETLSRLAGHATATRQSLQVRAPLADAARRWIAVVDERCIGLHASPEMKHLAAHAVRALRARTGVVEYVGDDDGAMSLVDVHAPAELSRIPSGWWSAYCLAVLERLV
jgi:hypothetical protein